MQRSPRPSVAQAAEILAKELGKPVSAALIRSAIRRHPEWLLEPPPLASTCQPALDYACERALGPIKEEDKSSFHWTMMIAYERVQAGLLARDRKTAKDAERYVAHRRRFGSVTDYSPAGGFETRPALPWELAAKAYFRMEPPEYARLELEAALARPELTEETRKYWGARLKTYRLASAVLAPRGSG